MSESTAGRLLRALDLMVGDRVRDDFTAWAEVVTIEDTPVGIRIEWRLADGRREVTTYDRDDEFTVVAS